MSSVLIVDDNVTLAFFTAQILRTDIEGLDAFVASSAAEARSIASKSCPQVLITDVKLADGDGRDLAEELTRIFPDLSAILISGEVWSDLTDRVPGCFLRKPYEADILVGLVKQALQGKSACPAQETSRASTSCVGYDRHAVQNRLAGLLAGLRALGSDVKARSDNPERVRQTLDEYLDRLCAIVKEVSRSLPICAAKGSHVAENGGKRSLDG